MDWKEAQEVGRHWGAGVRRRLWEIPNQNAARLGLLSWAEGPETGVEREGGSSLALSPRHFYAPVPGTEGPGAEPHPLRLVGESRCSQA